MLLLATRVEHTWKLVFWDLRTGHRIVVMLITLLLRVVPVVILLAVADSLSVLVFHLENVILCVMDCSNSPVSVITMAHWRVCPWSHLGVLRLKVFFIVTAFIAAQFLQLAFDLLSLFVVLWQEHLTLFVDSSEVVTAQVCLVEYFIHHADGIECSHDWNEDILPIFVGVSILEVFWIDLFVL